MLIKYNCRNARIVRGINKTVANKNYTGPQDVIVSIVISIYL